MLTHEVTMANHYEEKWKEAEKRAEIAERALREFAINIDCDECPFYQKCDLDYSEVEPCIQEYLRQAEKELSEERDV